MKSLEVSTVYNPFIPLAIGGVSPMKFGKNVVVGYEELPPAGPGEVQVGEGCGPREIIEFQELKPPNFDLKDLVEVQPMTKSSSLAAFWTAKVKAAKESLIDSDR